MQLRSFGRTDMQVSEIGLGGHQDGVETGRGVATTAHFFSTDQERARVVGHAIDAGITYFDTTFGCELASLGRVLHLLGRRDDCYVSAMRVDFFANFEREEIDIRAYTRREVEGRLEEFGFDAVDQFMMGAIDITDPVSTPDVVLQALDELGRMRDEGKLHTIGFSCHNPDYAARMLTAFPAFDTVMTPYNFANRVAEGAFATALKETGAAWIAMKPLVWRLYGMPVTTLRNLRTSPVEQDLDPSVPLAQLALRFILQNPLVATCVPAMANIDQVDEDTSASGLGDLSESETAQLAAYAAAMACDKGIPLAIGGLMMDNLRVRHFALQLLERELGFGPFQFDWTTDGAEIAVAQAAAAVLDALKEDDHWARLIP